MSPTPQEKMSQLQISSSASNPTSAVVLSDPAIDMDYVPGPGPGLNTNNPLALPPKRSSSPPPPPYSVLLSPPLESPSVNGGYYPSLPLSSTSDDSSSSFTSTFLRGILASMDSTDPVVANAWLETLLDALDLLPADAVRREVVPVAVAKGQLGRPAEVRRAAGRLLAKVATRLDAVTVRQEVLPTALSLCQDSDPAVRHCMCRHLAPLARALGNSEAARARLLPQLVELAGDEDARVRVAAVEAVAQTVRVVDDAARAEVIAPLVVKCCEQARQNEDESLPAIAHYLGRLCHGLNSNLTQEQRDWFVSFYKKLSVVGTHTISKKKKQKQQQLQEQQQKEVVSSSSDEEKPIMPDLVPDLDQDKSALFLACRRECAHNLPAMVLFAGGAAKFSHPEEGLKSTLNDLACDGAWQVRRALAAGLHELARLLGPAFCTAKTQVCNLFADDRPEVLEAMVANLVHVVDALARHGVLQFAGGASSSNSDKAGSYYSEELSRALLKCEGIVGSTRDWRLHADCLEKFSCLANCLSPSAIQGRFVPTLFERMLKARPLPCRNAAARTLLVVTRFTIRSADRARVFDRLRRDLMLGKSCHSRMLFLRACEMAASLFSRAYFKRHFLEDFLSLSKDTVANVRLKLCSSLPKFKSLLSLPSDRALLRKLEETVRLMLAKETDRDVLRALQDAIEGMDAVDTRVDGVPSMNAEEDREDDRKLREERLISSMEEQLGRIAAVSAENSPSNKPPPSMAQRQRSDLDLTVTSAETKRRSESLPPAPKGRREIPPPPSTFLARSAKLEPPKPHFSSADLSDLLSSSWQNQYKDRSETSSNNEEEEGSLLNQQQRAPYSSSLENLDPSAKEFLVDAGVTLDASSFSSMPNLSAKIMPAKETISKSMLPRASSASAAVFDNIISKPQNKSVGNLSSGEGGDISQFLISNEEMRRYEEEYQKASEEISNQVKIEQQQQKRRSRPESRLKPPGAGSSSLGGRIPQPNTSKIKLAATTASTASQSSFNTPAASGIASSSSLPRFSLQSKLANGTDKIQESIDKMTEKWEAKRKMLSSQAEGLMLNKEQQTNDIEQQRKREQFQEKRSASVGLDSANNGGAFCYDANSRIRAAIMEQRLQTIRHQSGGVATRRSTSAGVPPPGITQQQSSSMVIGKRTSLTEQFGLQNLGRQAVEKLIAMPGNNNKRKSLTDARIDVVVGNNEDGKHSSPYVNKEDNNGVRGLVSPLSPPPPAPSDKNNIGNMQIMRSPPPPPTSTNSLSSGNSVMSMLVQPTSKLSSANSGIAVMSGNRRAAPPPPSSVVPRAIPPPPPTSSRPRPPPPPPTTNRIPMPSRGQTSPRAPPSSYVITPTTLPNGEDKEITSSTRQQMQPPPYQRPPQYSGSSRSGTQRANNISTSSNVDIRHQINQRRESIEERNLPVPPPPAPSSPPPPSPPPPPSYEMHHQRGISGQVSISAIREKVGDEIASNTNAMQQRGRYTKLAPPRYRTSQQQQQQQYGSGRKLLSNQEMSSRDPSQQMDALGMQPGHQKSPKGGRNKSLSAESVLDSPQHENDDDVEKLGYSDQNRRRHYVQNPTRQMQQRQLGLPARQQNPKRMSQNSDGSSRSSSPNSSSRSSNSNNGQMLSPDSLEDETCLDGFPARQGSNNIRVAVVAEPRKSSGIRMWQGQQAPRGRAIPQPASSNNFQKTKDPPTQTPPTIYPSRPLREEQQHRRSPSPRNTSNLSASSTSPSNLTRGRPMVSPASKLKRPLQRGSVTTAAATAKPQTLSAATPLTQTTRRLYQRNSNAGSSAPNSPVKAAVQQQQQQQQQQHRRQKAASAHNSPGVSRSASPHTLQQQQQQQQLLLRRRSANFAASSSELPTSLPQQQQQQYTSGLPKMSYHRSQPQLTSYQQQQQQYQQQQQQFSRGSANRIPTASYQQRSTATATYEYQQQQQQRSRIAAPVPNNTEGRPRSFGLPTPGFAASSRAGSSSYIQKSM